MLKIGDLSKLSRVSVKALRYYDEMGLLKPAHVDRFTGYRYYLTGTFRGAGHLEIPRSKETKQ
jgi:hypothetical protein